MPGPDAITLAPAVTVKNPKVVTIIKKEGRKREIRRREHTGSICGPIYLLYERNEQEKQEMGK